MNIKFIIATVFFLSLLMIVTLFVLIEDREGANQNFGSNFFGGKLPIHSFTLISDFSKRELRNSKTILVLFDPGCEACYNEISSFVSHKDILNDFKIVVASGSDSSTIVTYIEKFELTGFQSLKVGFIDQETLGLYPMIYPTVIVYDEDGNFIKGFGGGEKVEKIIQ